MTRTRTTRATSLPTLALLAALPLLILACAEPPAPSPAPRAVAVTPAPAPADEPAPVVAEAPRPGQEEVADEIEGDEESSGGEEPAWADRLRALCKEIDKPKEVERGTAGADAWKNKLAVSVEDVRVFSPDFGRWTLHAVSASNMVQSIRRRGASYGIGMTVEVENKSDEVLTGDDVYAWATFSAEAGNRVCFAAARAERSWDPFAGKEKAGGWVQDRDPSEQPLRPGERKRYVVYAGDCLPRLFREAGPTKISIDVYLRFRTMAGEAVIVGPMASFERPGGLLRGMPVAAAAQNVLRLTKKAPESARALYMVGDHVLIAQEKSTSWVPLHDLGGFTPDSPPALADLPATSAPYRQTFGSLTVSVGGWKVEGWRTLNGDVAKGHRRMTADVELSIDTVAVQAALTAAVDEARNQVKAAEADAAKADAAAAAAGEAAAAAKGTDGFKDAKAAAGNAKKAAGAAKKAVKSAQSSLGKAEKALKSGVSAFLKTEAKAIDCGSFRVDVGRTVLRPERGSVDAGACKALIAGESVIGQITFDLERWDVPFTFTWTGSDRVLRVHSVASAALAAIPKD